MPTSFNPNDPYGIGNVTAAAAQIPTMVALPASLILNATIHSSTLFDVFRGETERR